MNVTWKKTLLFWRTIPSFSSYFIIVYVVDCLAHYGSQSVFFSLYNNSILPIYMFCYVISLVLFLDSYIYISIQIEHKDKEQHSSSSSKCRTYGRCLVWVKQGSKVTRCTRLLLGFSSFFGSFWCIIGIGGCDDDCWWYRSFLLISSFLFELTFFLLRLLGLSGYTVCVFKGIGMIWDNIICWFNDNCWCWLFNGNFWLFSCVLRVIDPRFRNVKNAAW